jgi:hypothetical protein
MHRAGAALRDAAAVLGAGQPELLAQHPQQRGVGFGIDRRRLAVDVQHRHVAPFVPGAEGAVYAWRSGVASQAGRGVF